MQANRRAELIQLAVDGFLTFLVAGDPADIALSRTTRSRFLRQLVRAIKLEHRSFNLEELISFTDNFAVRGDFEIDANEFITAFLEKGVLHFERGNIVFTLPFIESYLLALELKDDAHAASLYFEMGETDFDILTFDLYAELGAHVNIFDSIFEEIRQVRSGLALKAGEKNILTTGAITPSFLSKQDRLQGLQRRIEKALEDVQNDVGNVENKQRLLDVHDKVHAEATKGSRALGEEDITKNSLASQIEDASRVWAIATMLLGAGAEHLDANQKRRLAAEIVTTAGLILHHWTGLVTSIDFKDLKKNLVSAEFIDELLGDHVTDHYRSEVVGTVEMMVDVLEFNALSDPVRRMMNFLCEEAREKVLGVSIVKAELSDELDTLLQSIWLLDIDPVRGKASIKEAVKRMSPAPFLRVNVANHMLARAYWSHAILANKKALLAAANEALEVLGLSMRGRDLQRLVLEGPPSHDA